MSKLWGTLRFFIIRQTRKDPSALGTRNVVALRFGVLEVRLQKLGISLGDYDCHVDYRLPGNGKLLTTPLHGKGGFMAMAHVRVLLVDDHTMLRQGLRSALQIYPNIEVVGEAGNGEEAVASVKQLQPAVVVMDINMPQVDGITATQQITALFPHVAVVGLSVNTDSAFSAAMKQAGAVDVLTKDKALHELYRAIHRAAASIEPVRITQNVTVEVDEVFQVG